MPSDYISDRDIEPVQLVEQWHIPPGNTRTRYCVRFPARPRSFFDAAFPADRIADQTRVAALTRRYSDPFHLLNSLCRAAIITRLRFTQTVEVDLAGLALGELATLERMTAPGGTFSMVTVSVTDEPITDWRVMGWPTPTTLLLAAVQWNVYR